MQSLPKGILNTASLENLPLELREAVDELLKTYQAIYGEQLESVYVQGSSVRGEYEPGASDVNALAITSRPASPDDAHRLTRARQILGRGHNIRKLDARAMLRSDLDQVPREQFIIATDSILLYGRAYEPPAAFPEVGSDLARLLSGDFERFYLTAIRWVRQGSGTAASYESWGRSLAGRGLRLALGVSMTKRTAYTASLRTMPGVIEAGASDLGSAANRLLQIRLKPPVTKVEFDALLKALEPVRGAAAEAGITWSVDELESDESERRT